MGGLAVLHVWLRIAFVVRLVHDVEEAASLAESFYFVFDKKLTETLLDPLLFCLFVLCSSLFRALFLREPSSLFFLLFFPSLSCSGFGFLLYLLLLLFFDKVDLPDDLTLSLLL